MRGTDSYIIIFRQNGYDSPDPDTGDWPHYDGRASYIDDDSGTALRPYPYQPQTVSIGLMREGTTINASFFKGSPMHSKEGEGPASSGGDLVFNISGNGTGQIWQAIVQDDDPDVTRVATYTDTSILASTTAAGSTASTTFVDNLSDVRVALPVKVTMEASWTFTSSQTDGGITVTGTNRFGDTQSFTTTFTDAERRSGDPITKTTEIYFATVTRSEPNGNFATGNYKLDYDKPPHTTILASGRDLDHTEAFTANSTAPNRLDSAASNFGSTNVQPIYVVPDSATMANSTLFAYVNITGEDALDRQIVDRVRYQNNTDDLAKVKRTTAFFQSVTSVTVEGFNGGTFGLESVDQAHNVIFTPDISAIPVVSTIEAAKGNIVSLFRNCYFNTSSITFARDSAIQVTCDVQGGYAEVGRNGRGTATRTARTKLSYTSPDVFSGWQAEITIGNFETNSRSATFSANYNLEPSDLLGGKYASAPPTAGEREIVVTLDLQATEFNKFRDVFNANESLYDVQIELTNVSHGAFPHRIQLQFPEMQIVEDPDYPVTDFGVIGEALNLRAIWDEENDLEYEYRVVANYSSWYPLQDVV